LRIHSKKDLRDAGRLHFIESVVPSRLLDLTAAAIHNGDLDTSVQASSLEMTEAIANDTLSVLSKIGADEPFVFFAHTVEQAEAQSLAFRATSLRTAVIHGGQSEKERAAIDAAFRDGEYQSLCSVACISRGHDFPRVALAIIGFATVSRSRFEQISGRVQRVCEGKNGAWLLDYGQHDKRLGGAHFDYDEAIAFDHYERQRAIAEPLIATLREGRPHDPKCAVVPSRFHDLVEKTIPLFAVFPDPRTARDGRRYVLAKFVTGLGYIEMRTGGRGIFRNVSRTLPRYFEHLRSIRGRATHPQARKPPNKSTIYF
jgi:Helicase conserved C-terminal domain